MSFVRSLVRLLLLTLPACGQAQAPTPPPLPLSADSALALARQPLDPAVTRADLAWLAQAFESLHPGLYRYQTPAAWRARVDSLDAWFTQPRSRGDTYLALARLTASLRCSHTYLNFWNQSRDTKRWLLTASDKLPVTYFLDREDRWVVLRSAVPGGAILPGDTIVSVQERSTASLIGELLGAVRGDGDNDGKRRSLLELRDRKAYETIDALLPLILPPTEGMYRLRIRRGAGHPAGVSPDTTIVVRTMSAADRRATALPLRPERPNVEFTTADEIGILRVDGFEFESGWARFLRESFASLRQSGARALVVDLRENEGGSDEGAVQLLRYLIRAPITVPTVRRRVAYEAVPSALRPFLQTWDKSFYDRRGKVRPLGDGSYELTDREGWPESVQPVRNPFPGRIVVLTGPVNSSASHSLIRLLRGQPNITLVGAETGGSLRASTGGNLVFMRLPGSGLEVDIPLVGYEWGDAQPSGGVPPDVATSEGDALRVALALLRGG